MNVAIGPPPPPWRCQTPYLSIFFFSHANINAAPINWVNNKTKTKMYLIIEWILFCLHSDCACSGAFILRFTKNFNTVSRIFKCICVYLLAVIFVLFIMEIKLNKQCIKSVEIDCAALMLLVEISILGKVVNENWWSVCTMHSAMQWVLNFLTHAIHMMS